MPSSPASPGRRGNACRRASADVFSCIQIRYSKFQEASFWIAYGHYLRWKIFPPGLRYTYGISNTRSIALYSSCVPVRVLLAREFLEKIGVVLLLLRGFVPSKTALVRDCDLDVATVRYW